MSINNCPRVSIGLPVYNGENFLAEAIESILAQTFEDFELIISDNASTDKTETICRAYAAQDERIRYSRNSENIGAAPNFNLVFARSSGNYFKWASHDDICQPNFLLRCVQVLDQDPSVVLCYSRTATIDAEGQIIRERRAGAELASLEPHRRFREAIAPKETYPVWGLIRANILRRTSLIDSYPASDRALLAELSLYGRFDVMNEVLFLHREHELRSVRVYDWRDPHHAVVWYDPSKAGKMIFPEWRLFSEHVSAINRAPLSRRARLYCYFEMARWLRRNWQGLLQDLVVAGEHAPGIGPVVAQTHNAYMSVRKKYLEVLWINRLKRVVQDIKSVIPVEEPFILVDEATFGIEVLGQRAIPFLERDGQYWGRPPDDETAISELERLRRSGASFIVFGWPAFWWLDFYAELRRYLRSNFRCVLQNDRVVVFDLRS